MEISKDNQMIDRTDLFLDTLKQAGMRITPQRRAICAYLSATDTHPTAYQVYEDVAAIDPEISRATVYNTINSLRKLGAIVEVSYGDGQIRYETDPSPHVNLICLRCHKVQDYHGPLPLAELERAARAEFNFQPVAVKAELVGFCQECRDRKRAEIVAQLNTSKLTNQQTESTVEGAGS